MVYWFTHQQLGSEQHAAGHYVARVKDIQSYKNRLLEGGNKKHMHLCTTTEEMKEKMSGSAAETLRSSSFGGWIVLIVLRQ